MTTRPAARSGGRRRALPQPKPQAWSAELRPSQRRAAERRTEAEYHLSLQRWLRELARR